MVTRVLAISFAAIVAASAAQVREAPLGWLVEPTGKKSGCAILFVHWYDSEAGDSNRNQYLREAIPLADRDGCVSLLVDTMWSKTTWFLQRDASKDFENSNKQVANLGKAVDYLASQKPKRILYVGHDFGAMYGMVLASREKRISGWAFQAATASFSDWFLYFPRKQGSERQAVIDQLAPLDPAKHIASASPVLLQFGKRDPHVPEPKAKLLIDAAREPKEVHWYDAGHALNEQAVEDRLKWIRAQLSLPAKPR